METIDYRPTLIEPPKPTGLIWAAVAILGAGLLGVLIWQITTIIQLFRRLTIGDALGSPFWISFAIVAAAVGLMVLELYSVWFRSRRASEAIGTIFAAPAFIVLPPIIEALAKLVHIPGISDSSADWKTVGIMLAVGAVCGFLAYAHFLWYGHLRHGASVLKVESIPEPVAAAVEPPPISTS